MKVLIVRLSAIGDVVQGIPCLVALKESFPDWEISWLVEETCAPILAGHPHLKQLFVLHRRWRKKKPAPTPMDLASGAGNAWNTWRALRRENFDIAIDLQGLFKSGLWTRLSGAPRRIGHNRTREFAHHFLNEFASDRPTFDPAFPLVERYLEPARHLGADAARGRYILPASSRETVAEVDKLLEPKNNSTPLVALCPWSLWPSKNWPLEFWRETAVSLAADFRVLLIGAGADLPQAEKIGGGVLNVLNLAGKTSLIHLMEIFRRCRLVIGPDSGPVHLANAAGVPRVLMIFGSTSWRRSGPLGSGHRALSLDLSCQPCFERLCPLSHLNCLHQIKPQRILETAHELV